MTCKPSERIFSEKVMVLSSMINQSVKVWSIVLIFTIESINVSILDNNMPSEDLVPLFIEPLTYRGLTCLAVVGFKVHRK